MPLVMAVCLIRSKIEHGIASVWGALASIRPSYLEMTKLANQLALTTPYHAIMNRKTWTK